MSLLQICHIRGWFGHGGRGRALDGAESGWRSQGCPGLAGRVSTITYTSIHGKKLTVVIFFFYNCVLNSMLILHNRFEMVFKYFFQGYMYAEKLTVKTTWHMFGAA